MMTITLLVSGLLVGAFGYLVVELTTRDLLDRAHGDVENEVENGAEYARGQLSIHLQPGDARLPATMLSIVASRSDGRRLVAIVPPPADGLDEVTSWGQPVTGVVSDALVEAVANGDKAWQIVTDTLEPGGEAVTYLAYGAPVPPGWGGPQPFQLYYLVPLTSEVSQANDIRSTVLATGAALVLLLAVVTGLVTRLVVRPVRLAARTAQRLSAGLLDQRMVVQGEDDLALLGASFNQMAESLQRQIVRLEEMSRLQRRFTSDVSHELRTPLTTVRMAADLIFNERGSYPPEVGRSAELLQHELDRFEALLTDLLEISRFDAGFAALDSELTDLVPVVRQAVDRLSAIGARAGTEVQVSLPATAVIAEVDPRRVDRILRNLVENAIEYGEGRPVVVTLAAGVTAAAVTVRDHGVGMRPDDRELVFSRFWRADPSRARQSGGTGLGLSISVEDARLHGGWLQAWGAPGRGCQFRLTLPLRAGDRLVSSPLPLVPGDADPVPADTAPAAGAAPTSAVSPDPGPAGAADPGPPAAERTGAGVGQRSGLGAGG
ncbi:MAG: HAMP domain-containing protein [Micromonosporaceae bacterium]|nr:HAMP domain-containing protein [Micromonosporaceae bacterium]